MNCGNISPRKHLHIVVQLPPMREYACHSFMLPTLLLMLLCFFAAAPYIYVHQCFMLSDSPTSPFYVFSSTFTHVAMLTPNSLPCTCFPASPERSPKRRRVEDSEPAHTPHLLATQLGSTTKGTLCILSL
jgi:hypothetical protein